MEAKNLPTLISLSSCFALTSHFFGFGCRKWRFFVSEKTSSCRPCLHKNMRRLRILNLDPFVSDLFLGSCRREKIIAAFNATIEFGVSPLIDNSCWFSKSMN